jgi:AraC-like DNA-binding protein
LAAHVAQVFKQLEDLPPDNMLAEQSLLFCLMHALQKHGIDGPRPVRASPSVARAVSRLEAVPEVATSLAELAMLSDVSRFQLLRGFSREVGVTPHAYLIQLRVKLARRHLALGRPLAEAALKAGFADQSHMSRAFVRQFGVTPGRYQAALGPTTKGWECNADYTVSCRAFAWYGRPQTGSVNRWCATSQRSNSRYSCRAQTTAVALVFDQLSPARQWLLDQLTDDQVAGRKEIDQADIAWRPGNASKTTGPEIL